MRRWSGGKNLLDWRRQGFDRLPQLFGLDGRARNIKDKRENEVKPFYSQLLKRPDVMRRRLSGRRSSHSMNVVVSGLDVHKDYTYATILGPDGEKLAQRKMPNEEVPDFLKPYGVERVAMEATTSIAPSTGSSRRKGTTSSSPTRRRQGTSRRPASSGQG